MGPSPRIGVAELKKRQRLEKGAECVGQVEKCAWACTPHARGVSEIKAFRPGGF